MGVLSRHSSWIPACVRLSGDGGNSTSSGDNEDDNFGYGNDFGPGSTGTGGLNDGSDFSSGSTTDTVDFGENDTGETLSRRDLSVADFIDEQVSTNVSIAGDDSFGYTFTGYDSKNNVTKTNTLDLGLSGAYTVNRTTGWFDTELDSIETRMASGGTVSGSTLASELYNIGLTAVDAITIEATVEAAINVALGSPIGAIAPVAKALQAQGIIDEQTSKTLQAIGHIASFMKGTISNIQAAKSVVAAKSYGAVTSVQAAILGGMIAYSEYGMISQLNSTMNRLGFNQTKDIGTASMDAFGIRDGGDGNSYFQGVKVTDANIGTAITAYVKYMSKPAEELEYDPFMKMAGGILVNSYLAGGDLWNPMHSPSLSSNMMMGIGSGISELGTWGTMGSDYVWQQGTNSTKNYR